MPQELEKQRIQVDYTSGPSTSGIMAALGDDLLSTVNKLQDLVFNTIGNDSLDLPQIVSQKTTSACYHSVLGDHTHTN